MFRMLLFMSRSSGTAGETANVVNIPCASSKANLWEERCMNRYEGLNSTKILLEPVMANATMIMMMKYNNFPSFKISVSHARHSYDSSYEHHLHNKKVKLSP